MKESEFMKWFNIEIDNPTIVDKFCKLLKMNKIKYESSDLDGHGKHLEIYCDEETAKTLDDALDVMFNIQNSNTVTYRESIVEDSNMSEIALENELPQPDIDSSSKSSSTNTDENEITDKNGSEEDNDYRLLLKSYKNKKRFHDRHEQSGEYLDFIKDLKHKDIPYDIYISKKSKGCTVFYG